MFYLGADVDYLIELSNGIPYAKCLSGADSYGRTGTAGRNDKLKTMVAASLESGDSLDLPFPH